MRNPKAGWLLLVACLLATGARAQEFEIGAATGIGFAWGLRAEGAAGATAKPGIKPGATAGFYFSDNMYSRVSGELRYLYRGGAFQVKREGTSASLAGHSHLFHYDLLYHMQQNLGRFRPFVAAGLGGRVYQGTGTPPRIQPLSQFVLLRKATEMKPMISLGGGLKWTFRPKILLRMEVRDYLTPTPRKVLAPSTTSSVSGWLHDIVPQISVAVTF